MRASEISTQICFFIDNLMIFHVSLSNFLHLHHMGPQPWFPSPEGAIQRAPQPWSPHHKASPPMLFLYVELIHSAPVKYENSIHYVFTLLVMRFLCLFWIWFPYHGFLVLSLMCAPRCFLYSSSSYSQPRSAFFKKNIAAQRFFSGQQIRAWYVQLKRSFVWSLFHDPTLIYIFTILFE